MLLSRMQVAAVCLCVLAGAAPAAPAFAQSGAWQPSKPVELLVGVSPGGGIDRTARVVQKIIDGRQLLEALKTPESLPIGIATAAGNTNHIAAAIVAKIAGADPRRLKIVVF